MGGGKSVEIRLAELGILEVKFALIFLGNLFAEIADVFLCVSVKGDVVEISYEIRSEEGVEACARVCGLRRGCGLLALVIGAFGKKRLVNENFRYRCAVAGIMLNSDPVSSTCVKASVKHGSQRI